jgi:hypothetical protein
MTGSLHPVPGDAQGELHAHPIGKQPKVTKAGIIVGTLFLAGLGVFFYFTSKDNVAVGQCASVAEQGKKPAKLVKADCGSPAAVYQLAYTRSNHNPECPQGDYFEDFDSGGRGNRTDTVDCYTLNVREGDCLRAKKYVGLNLSERVPCSGAERKVDKIVQGKADTKLCTDPATSVSYSNPVRTVCLSKV